MQWYYTINRQSKGPVPEEEFQSLVQTGAIKPDALVWHEGMAQWAAYGSLTAAGAPAPGPAVSPAVHSGLGLCAECRRHFPADEMVPYQDLYVCAECKPRFFQRLQEGGDLPTVMNCGGFRIRFVAKFIDNIIVGVISFVVTFAMGLAVGLMPAAGRRDGAEFAVPMTQLLANAIQIALAVAYDTFFVGKFGATPGKMACRLKVVRSDGGKLTYGRAFGRVFATCVSHATLGIGFLMVAFDDEKRALHDRIADTRVIRI
ncbi:MAG: RDD family protein [Verrucomicrobiota bacterium]|nr:RDD family protein [Verrucomicrobiota bacterium]